MLQRVQILGGSARKVSDLMAASFRVPLGVLRHSDLKSLEKLSVGLRWKYASGHIGDAPEPLTDYLDVSASLRGTCVRL